MENTTVVPTTAGFLDAATKNGGMIFFTWYDYLLCLVLLSTSMSIGIYFGCCGKTQTSANDYLMGGKSMKVVPVAISLIASHTSGITLLAVPAEIYVFGAAYWLSGFSLLFLIVATNYVFLPVFYKLQLVSTYEYLGIRFDARVRKISSFLFGIAVFFFLPIVIYIPSLAFAAASGLDVHLVTCVVCGVCIFYTTIGGMKALIWTDTLQFSLTMVIMTTVCFVGISTIGGMGNLFRASTENGRLAIWDFDPDPTKRESFWTIFIGLSVHWIAHTSVNQGCTQKFLSVPTLSESKKTVTLYCLGMIIVKTLSVLNGLVMAVKYSHCDPFTTKKVQRNDELLPIYVLDVTRNLPGLAGMFTAGIFAASLSTLSANLNSLAGTIYEDFLKRYFIKSDKHNAGFLLKILVVIIGVISTMLVYVVEHLGGILSLSIGLGSVAHGPLLGMFMLGMMVPSAKPKGAFYGALSAMLVMGSVCFGNHYYKARKMIRYPHKPVFLDQCPQFENFTISAFTNATSPAVPETYVLPIFKLSFYYYTLVGATICMVVGVIVSYFDKEEQAPVAKELLSPVIYRFLQDGVHPEKANIEYTGVEDALKKVENGNNDDILRRKSLRLEKMRKASIISDVIDD